MRGRIRPPHVAALALCLALVFPASSRGDTLVLADGSRIDGKVLRETAEFIWVKTLGGVEKLKVGDVTSREEGESPVDVYARLSGAAKKDAKDVDAQFALYEFCAANADQGDLGKEAQKLLKRVLKLDPDHAKARDANGEVLFEKKWVRKTDLPRLKAEWERNREKNEWSKRLKVPVEVYKTDHFILVDGTKDKDLPRRAEAMEEAYALLAELFAVEGFWSGQSATITLKKYDEYLGALDDFQKQWRMSDAWYQFAKSETGGGVWRDRPEPTQLRFPSSGAEGMWYATVHNVAHLAAWRQWGGRKAPPTWLEEGLGTWVEFEVMDENLASCVGFSGLKKGGTNDRPRKKRGKKGGKLSDTQNEWKEICIQSLQDGDFPEMRKFLNMKMGDYGPAEAGGALGLVTWLIGRDREKFAELMSELRFAPKPDDPWRKVYGYDLIEDMEKDWKVWVLSEW